MWSQGHKRRRTRNCLHFCYSNKTAPFEELFAVITPACGNFTMSPLSCFVPRARNRLQGPWQGHVAGAKDASHSVPRCHTAGISDSMDASCVQPPTFCGLAAWRLVDEQVSCPCSEQVPAAQRKQSMDDGASASKAWDNASDRDVQGGNSVACRGRQQHACS